MVVDVGAPSPKPLVTLIISDKEPESAYVSQNLIGALPTRARIRPITYISDRWGNSTARKTADQENGLDIGKMVSPNS